MPLRFYVTQQTRLGDRHLHAMRSRFLPREVLEVFEAGHWSPTIAADRNPIRARPTIDISAKLRERWGLPELVGKRLGTLVT